VAAVLAALRRLALQVPVSGRVLSMPQVRDQGCGVPVECNTTWKADFRAWPAIQCCRHSPQPGQDVIQWNFMLPELMCNLFALCAQGCRPCCCTEKPGLSSQRAHSSTADVSSPNLQPGGLHMACCSSSCRSVPQALTFARGGGGQLESVSR
jgi:hypothetical protein